MMKKSTFYLGAGAIALLTLTSTLTLQAKNGLPSTALEKKVDYLNSQLQRADDVRQVQNVVSQMAYLYEAGMYEERLQYVAKKTPGVTIEIGARGVFEGFEGARRCFVDIEKSFERSNGEGMRKDFPNVKFSSDHAGQFESELIGTPVIEIAGDGKTARGQWISLMTVGKTHAEDPKPQAIWIWWKTSIDFVKEDGEWKVWHYRKNPYYATPYNQDWVEHAMGLPDVTGLAAKGLPGDHGGHPDRPAQNYDSYRITREPNLAPPPPKPYKTFDPKDSYAS